MADEFDAVIVGSGAGGGTVAYALTQAGMRVCMLEKGPHYTQDDFVHDELAVCRRWFFSPSPFDEPNVVAAGGKPASPSANGWIACCVGGGTVHMSGFFFRLRSDDLRLRTLHGAPAGSSLADWPITHDDLVPHYDEIERLIGVSGDASTLPSKQTAFPVGPMAQHPVAPIVDAAIVKAGRRGFQTPRAIITGAYDGRAACHYCGFCASYGCEVGAKSSTLASLIPLAQKTGKLTIRANAHVLTIEKDEAGRARDVVYTDGTARQRVRGRVVIVAAGAVQTARLLLASGLANQSGMLGKHLMFSGQSQSSGRFALPHASFATTGRDFPFLDRSIADFYLTKDKRFAHPKAGVIMLLMPHINPIFQAEVAADRGPGVPPLWGSALTKRLREHFRETRRVEVETFTEFFPHDGSRVELDDKVKDKHGQPAARITTSLHPATLQAAEILRDEGERVLAAAGATVERPPRAPDVYWFLQAGTARMVAKPSDGVIGADGQAFDVKNLYVADGAALPSGGGAPFTLTIMANALRIARGIAVRASRGEL
jgi:choline dehydrogenase-like flavoprotein